jgi:hypothetical protein
MEEFSPAFTGGEGYERLVRMLEVLSHDALEIVQKRPECLKEVELMAAYIAEIRQTLSQISFLQMRADGSGIPQTVTRALSDRFLELEGRVKELRNDLVRSDNRRSGKG